jgi:hypothetical protein
VITDFDAAKPTIPVISDPNSNPENLSAKGKPTFYEEKTNFKTGQRERSDHRAWRGVKHFGTRDFP